MKPCIVLLCTLAACGPARRPDPLPELPRSEDRPVRGDRVVAFLDGQPITWQAVAEKALELDPKGAVDQYVRWRIIEDRKRELGIRHAPEELRRRAESYVARLKAGTGPEAFRAELLRQGLNEAAYVRQLESSDFLAQILTFDKIVRYADILEECLEYDVLDFGSAAEAEAFRGRATDFEAALKTLPPGAGARRLRFPRSRPPAGSGIISHEFLQKLMNVESGAIIGVEIAPENRYIIARARTPRGARKATYEEVRREVWEDILSHPPGPQEYSQWMEQARAARKVEYGAPPPRKEEGR